MASPVGAFEQTPYRDPYLSTLWGIYQITTTFGLGSDTRTYRVRVPGLKNTIEGEKGLPVQMALHRRGVFNQIIEKRPLLIYLPGIGSNHSGNWPRYSLPKFFAKGYHVVSLPNPMSEDFASRRHVAAPGAIVDEASTQRQVVAQVMNMIGRDSISSVHFLGESYGAMIGAIMTAQDVVAPRKEQILDPETSHVVLVSPPLDFKHSIELIDKSIAETQNQFETQCQYFNSNLKVFYQAVFGPKVEEQISSSIKGCARSMVVSKGFKEKALEAAKAYETSWGLQVSPLDRATYALWKLKMTIGQAFHLYNSRAAEVLENPETRDFGFWISQVRRNSDLNLTLIGSEDDFLNDADSWRQNPYFQYINDRLWLMSRGGHLGFVITDEFRRVIDHALPGVE